MYKSIVFAVALCLVAVCSNAEDEYITIHNMKPENNTVINECPSFSWSSRHTSTGNYYIKIYKQGTSTPVVDEVVNGVPHFEISPYDIDKFLAKGKYTWSITTDDGDKSETLSFSVNEFSCIPPKVENKIDNTFASFNDYDTVTFAGSRREAWEHSGFEKMKVNKSGVVQDVYFYPHSGERIYTLKVHESFVEGGGTVSSELNYSIATQQFNPDVGDNVLAFRYVYFTTGGSTIHVELKETDGNIIYLGCIGTTPDPHYNIPCELDQADKSGNHFSPSIAIKDNTTEPKWDLFRAILDEPRKDTKMITVRLRYQRAPKTKDDGYGEKLANYIFFMSEFTFGQCSTVRDDYYDQANTSKNLNEECPVCPSAGMRCSQKYINHCMDCEQTPIADGKCESSNYCTACKSHDGKCEVASSSTCRKDVNCSSKAKKTECKDDCAWCELDGKCVFSADRYSSCSTCGSFTSSATCGKLSSCKWCPTLQLCVKTSDECPSCNFIAEDACSYDETDGSCQFCYNQSLCLNTNVQCTAACSSITDPDTCNTYDDCQWCVSTNNCIENRIGCSECHNIPSDQCVKSKYPGCTLCDTLFCTSDPDKCPVCSDRTAENCEFEQGVRLNCQYCNSSQMCMSKYEECKECKDITNATSCRSYSGCSFCNSEQVCKSSDETLTDCDCLGLSATACATHSRGCCWSSANTKCYDVGDNNCESGLDTTTIIIICVCVGVFVAAAAIITPILICCCKPKTKDDIEMTAPGTIVVLPEGQPSMVVQESLQSVNVDPATAVSVDETSAANAGMPQSTSMADMQNMQNMIAQQQMLNTMMAQQQMSMMMNPMMMNSMGTMNMMNMSGMAGMSGMNSMGMDMNSMNMTGGMSGMGSMNMTGGMDNSMQNGAMPSSQGPM